METKTKILILKSSQILKDEDINKFEGTYFPESHYNHIIKSNCDVYYLNNLGEKILLLKFRKNVIPQKICIDAYHALEQHAKKRNYNRGAASGKLNINKLPSYAQTVKQRQSFRAYYTNKSGKQKKDHISNMALSNIAGYYDKPDRNLSHTKDNPKCRTTQFTTKQLDKWHDTIPLLTYADSIFKSLVPDAYERQYQRILHSPKYQIANTAFSTITLNYNWRTACHKDRGDYNEGFGNLIVLEKDKCIDNASAYKGGYLGFPKWKVAVDVRQGDFLAMDVHQWHCNTEIIEDNDKDDSDKILCNKNLSINCDYGRLSIVCYLRHGMIKCNK